MPYTLAEAAVACGLDKSTVRRAVRAGRISGTKNDLGVWSVEPVELHRVFPPAARTEDDTTAVPLHAPADAATDILVAELRAIIRSGERREEDLRQERDRWREAFERQQRLLSAPEQRPSTALAPIAAPPAHQGAPGPAEPVSRLRRDWRWMQATE
jgi:hypothetical protein